MEYNRKQYKKISKIGPVDFLYMSGQTYDYLHRIWRTGSYEPSPDNEVQSHVVLVNNKVGATVFNAVMILSSVKCLVHKPSSP